MVLLWPVFGQDEFEIDCRITHTKKLRIVLQGAPIFNAPGSEAPRPTSTAVMHKYRNGHSRTPTRTLDEKKYFQHRHRHAAAWFPSRVHPVKYMQWVQPDATDTLLAPDFAKYPRYPRNISCMSPVIQHCLQGTRYPLSLPK